MKIKFQTYGSNLPNRYDMIMPTEVLCSILTKNWNKPIPTNLGHDKHRPIGYNSPSTILIQPHLTLLFGNMYIAETDDEFEIVSNVCKKAASDLISEYGSEKIEKLKDAMKDNLTSDFELCAPSCLAIKDKEIVSKVFPELYKNLSKDGLIPINELKTVSAGVYEKDGLLIFAHSFFRRSLSIHNTLNEPFLRKLHEVSKLHNQITKIAIDPDLIGLSETLENNIELQYWWGPKFDNNLEHIKLGVSRHEGSKTDEVYNAIDRTEFWWYEQDDRKTFECEDLRPLDLPSCGYSDQHYGSRFVHSILDPKTKIPYHLDGAIRLYDEDQMLERVDKDIMEFGRRAEYTKLWRVDGEIPIGIWKELITHYYRDNHLIGEYFGAQKEDLTSSDPTNELQKEVAPSFENFVPLSPSREDGVLASISILNKSDSAHEFELIPTETYTDHNETSYYIESHCVDLMKLLSRNDINIHLDEAIRIIAFDNLAVNIPILRHNAKNSAKASYETNSVLLEYFKALAITATNRVVSWQYEIAYKDARVHFSFLAPIKAAIHFLDSDTAKLPNSLSNIDKWSSDLDQWLSQEYKNHAPSNNIHSFMHKDGQLYFPRKFVSNSDIHKVDEKGNLHLKESPLAVMASKYATEESLTIKLAYIVEESSCVKCKSLYTECPCIRIVDTDTYTNTTKLKVFGFFWTTLPA